MVDNRPHNYGKLYILLKSGNWIQGHGMRYDYNKKQMCYCISMGLYKAYDDEQEFIAAYHKLVETIRKMFPERTSPLRTKIKENEEPLKLRTKMEYSLTSFNDNTNTTFEDVMNVIVEAQV